MREKRLRNREKTVSLREEMVRLQEELVEKHRLMPTMQEQYATSPRAATSLPGSGIALLKGRNHSPRGHHPLLKSTNSSTIKLPCCQEGAGGRTPSAYSQVD